MTHAIENSRDHVARKDSASAAHSGPRRDDVVPTVDSTWDRPVLTIRDRETEHSLTDVRELSIMFGTEGLCVSPWSSGDQIRIQGEDLFALRELLAEVPESAFRRPKDPVYTPAFVKTGSGRWCVECVDGTFRLAGTRGSEFGFWEERSRGGAGLSLESVDSEWGGIDSTPGSGWAAGDIVRECWADGEDILGRDTFGTWTSVKGTSSVTHDDGDIDHFLREGQHLGSYSYQAIRKSGVFL